MANSTASRARTERHERTRNVLCRHAEFYLSHGFSILPVHFPQECGDRIGCSCGRSSCRNIGKHPVAKLVQRGCNDATNDLATAKKWFSEPYVNLGIATGTSSGIVVLDIDPRHGGHESLARLERANCVISPTWRFLTGGGGEHLLFRHPSIWVRNSAGRIGPGIDVRGEGGYIVAPPSLHASGRHYSISPDHRPDQTPIAEVPEWLLTKIQCSPTKKKQKKSSVDTAVPTIVDEGKRNDTIARLSGLLLAHRINPHFCLELMLAFNATRCRPPLPDEEIAITVANIARREMAKRLGRRSRAASRG